MRKAIILIEGVNFSDSEKFTPSKSYTPVMYRENEKYYLALYQNCILNELIIEKMV